MEALSAAAVLAAEPERRRELEALRHRLEDRASIALLAWAFGLSCVAFVMGGVAIKLFRDSATPPKIAFVLAAAAVGEVVVAAMRLSRGLHLYQTELADFARMQTLRRELDGDQPSLPAA